MFSKVSYLFLFAFFLLTACNPECDNLGRVIVAGHPLLKGQEILIQVSGDADGLRDQDVFFNGIPGVDPEFIPEVGLIVGLPPALEGANVEMRIEDPDCESITSLNLDVRNAEFFTNNATFIPPAPLQVIIPPPNPPIPPTINNAWISPDNQDYCIWFRMVPVEGSVGSLLITPDLDSTGNFRSRELSVERLLCGADQLPGSDLYHDHPVFGMADTVSNIVQFWIDRGDLGIEEFEGSFIDIEQTDYAGNNQVPDCSGDWDPNKFFMMLVTSKQTGRSLVLYQQGFR